jgi:prepilin-type N-terminal cleavage/methylation domain-containing protein
MKIKRQTVGDGAGRIAPRGQAGMTLVEVVVALAVTGLAVAGIVNGYRYCTNSAQKASMAQAANALAMERIEETRSAKWDTSSWPTVDQLVATNFPIKSVILDRAGSGVLTASATIRTEISTVSTKPPLKRIRVDCVWQYNGFPITNSIETLRAPDQ